MRIVTVPIMSDNFAYLIIDEASKIAAVVDPAEPATVLEAIKREGVDCKFVLTTHSHFDHAGGNSTMAKSIPGIEIVGGKGDNALAVTKEVGEGDLIKIGAVDVHVLFTPCHTQGHVTFVADAKDGSPKCAFTGDTMFVAGCGNLNSGTPAQMYTALCEKIGTLPPETLVYVGHEYTVKNLMFAVTVEPENAAIRDKLQWAKDQVANGKHTVPSTIAAEHATNPFLRCREPSLMAYTGKKDPVECLGEVRARKNVFRG